MFLWSPITQVYLYYLYPNKESKKPNLDNPLKNSAIYLLNNDHAHPNSVFTVKKDSRNTNYGPSPMRKKQLPHNSIMRTHQLWLLKQWYLLLK